MLLTGEPKVEDDEDDINSFLLEKGKKISNEKSFTSNQRLASLKVTLLKAYTCLHWKTRITKRRKMAMEELLASKHNDDFCLKSIAVLIGTKSCLFAP